MPGSASFGCASGATKYGITKSSSERRVSPTSERRPAVRRNRRSRATGNVLIRPTYRPRAPAPPGSRARRRAGPAHRPPTARGARARRRTPRRRGGPRASGARERRPADRRERVDDECVHERRNRTEPGPEVWDQLGEGDPGAEEQRVVVLAVRPAQGADQPEADAGADTDDQRDEHLSLDVAGDGGLDAAKERLRAGCRREAAVDPAGQAVHVQEHVDRDVVDQY